MAKKLTQKQFIEKAIKVHGNKYDYSKTTYVNARTKVTVICKTHGEFEVLAQHHINKGTGCKACSADVKRKSKEIFVEQANKVHGNKYDYTDTVYVTAKKKVKVKCPIHGEFEVKPSNHLTGKLGCTKCTPKGFSDTAWEELGKSSTEFDSFKLYIIKCWNNAETFYKIGKTFKTLEARFVGFQYSWEKIMTIEDTAKNVSILERRLHKQNGEHSYVPEIKFKGRTECFKQLT